MINEPTQVDNTFSFVMKRMVKTGQAPFYTEVAKALGVSIEEGRKALHNLFGPLRVGWLYANTDYVASFPPFSNLPTQYRITIDGKQKWFGQWGFESLAVSWLFPGKIVRIDAPCLDCGSHIRVEMKDGQILRANKALVGYTSVPFREWFADMPYSWSTMNLFRSEEHARKWTGFKAGTEGGILPLTELLQMFSLDLFRRRLDPDYVSKGMYFNQSLKALAEFGKTHPFWAPAQG